MRQSSSRTIPGACACAPPPAWPEAGRRCGLLAVTVSPPLLSFLALALEQLLTAPGTGTVLGDMLITLGAARPC